MPPFSKNKILIHVWILPLKSWPSYLDLLTDRGFIVLSSPPIPEFSRATSPRSSYRLQPMQVDSATVCRFELHSGLSIIYTAECNCVHLPCNIHPEPGSLTFVSFTLSGIGVWHRSLITSGANVVYIAHCAMYSSFAFKTHAANHPLGFLVRPLRLTRKERYCYFKRWTFRKDF